MQELYRMIPKVDIFLQKKAMQALIGEYGRNSVTEALREALAGLRRQAEQLEKGTVARAEQLENGAAAEAEQPEREQFIREIETMEESVKRILVRKQSCRFHHVINATGTVLHTNLGRAPLAQEQVFRLEEKLQGYSNLEYDLCRGKRGERYSHFEELLIRLTGAEAAVAVNNNAAAVLLTLSALSAGKEVIVSRGELIEIGGKFRIPEVIEQGGAVLREVGTTNKTHREDYARAVNEHTGAILKVHTSNYRIQGFTESVPVTELTGLGVPVIEDLGSGVLVNLETFGLEHEPTVQEAVRSGADVVCFSGDKLLGGPQAGIIAGKKELIGRIKTHPLMRAVRIDKFTAAALEMTLQEYEKAPDAVWERIPVLRMLKQKQPQLRDRAVRLRDMLLAQAEKAELEGWRLEILDCCSQAGGGSLPGQELPSAAMVISGTAAGMPGAEQLQERLRFLETPVIGRIARDKLWLDMRAVFEEELPILAAELAEVMTGQRKDAREK
ncbi:MAG: L-seryl-tRNA(Sec) selenium transferase [Lachnospiraceae bacterium]|nr:L-seryl-tRNA(Sec) selenium transferase [Lachnospiraceae bacterium]